MKKLEIQMRAIACLMFSSVNRKPVLKGFSKAWYLSIANNDRVTAEVVIAISLRTKNLQENFPNALLGYPM